MRLRFLAFCLLCLAWLSGCGSDSGQTLPTDAQGNLQLIQSNQSTLNSKVRLLPNNDSIRVDGLTANSVILSGQLPPLSVGDILSRSEGDNQFIRRIVAIQSNGGQTTVTTEAVGLDDVFDSADINITTFLGPEFLRTLQPELQGVSFGEPSLVQAKAEDTVSEFTLPVTFNETIISDGARGSVVVNGTVNLRFAIHSELKVGLRNFVVPTVNKFALQPIVTVEGDLTVTGEGSGDFRKEVLLTRIAYPLVGPFPPVSLYMAGDLVLSVDGNVQANGQLKMSGRVRMQSGVDCTNDVWSPVNSLDSTFAAQAPQIFAQARLNANVLQPRLTVSLLDMGQVFINANPLRFEVEADATESSFNVKVFRTYSLEAGAKLSISAKLFGFGVDIKIDRYLPPLQGPRTEVAALSVGKPPAPSNTIPVLIAPLFGTRDLRLGEEGAYLSLGFFGFIPLPTFSEWSSSNPAVVQVRNFGFFGIARAVGAGSAEVRANVNPASQGFFPVNVSSSGLRSLLVVDDGASFRAANGLLARQITSTNQVNVLDSKRFRVMGVYADQSQVDLTYSVNLSTSDPGKARVFRDGQLLGLSSGVANLTATFQNLSTALNVLVNIPEIQYMHITPLDPVAVTLDVNQSFQLTSVGRFSNGNVIDTTRGATWRSLSPSIASVELGKVTGLKAGETTIEAVVSSGAVVATKRVRVNALAVTGVEVEPNASANLRTGSSLQFRAFARYSDNSREEVTTLAKWFSNNDGVASISSTGLLTTKEAPGRLKVKATYNNKTGSTELFEVNLASTGNRTLRLRNPLPTSSNVGRLLPLDVEVLDGNSLDSSFNGDISVSKGANSANGNLTGRTLVTAQNGVARFTDLSFDSVGAYNLVVSGAGAPDLTPATITVQAAGFETPTNPSTGVGTRPLGLAFGHLNDDSALDLVTANGLAQSASVLINDGSGGFASPLNQPIGANSPEDVAVADMNGDGRDDFVVVSQSSNGVHLFLRQPDGTFTRNDMAAQTNPFGVAVGLVTQGDSRPDIVVANVGSASVTLLSQAPNGGYSASHFAVGQSPNAVALADLNGDGRMDITTSNFDSNSVSLCYQNADGSFNVVSQTVSDRPEDVVIDDIDGDGRADLAVACASGDLTLLLQKSANTFTRSNLPAGSIPVAVASGDINGDGLVDVVVGNLFSANMSYFQQNSSGGFDRSSLAAEVGPRAVVIADLNGDGRLDIACANETSSTVTVILTH